MGAAIDYCTAGIRSVDSGASTQNIPVQGNLRSGASGPDAFMRQSVGGTISQLRVYIVSHDRGATTLKLVTSQAVQPLPGLSVSFDNNSSFPGLLEHTTVSVPFDAGDDLRWQITTSSAGTTAISYISAKVEFDE